MGVSEVTFEHVVQPGTGKAVEMRAGQILRIEQVEGGQCVDFNCFNLNDYKEFMHCGRTRTVHGFHPSKGTFLWSAPPREQRDDVHPGGHLRPQRRPSFRGAAPIFTKAPTDTTFTPIARTSRLRRNGNTASLPTTSTTASTSSCAPK